MDRRNGGATPSYARPTVASIRAEVKRTSSRSPSSSRHRTGNHKTVALSLKGGIQRHSDFNRSSVARKPKKVTMAADVADNEGRTMEGEGDDALDALDVVNAIHTSLQEGHHEMEEEERAAANRHRVPGGMVKEENVMAGLEDTIHQTLQMARDDLVHSYQFTSDVAHRLRNEDESAAALWAVDLLDEGESHGRPTQKEVAHLFMDDIQHLLDSVLTKSAKTTAGPSPSPAEGGLDYDAEVEELQMGKQAMSFLQKIGDKLTRMKQALHEGYQDPSVAFPFPGAAGAPSASLLAINKLSPVEIVELVDEANRLQCVCNATPCTCAKNEAEEEEEGAGKGDVSAFNPTQYAMEVLCHSVPQGDGDDEEAWWKEDTEDKENKRSRTLGEVNEAILHEVIVSSSSHTLPGGDGEAQPVKKTRGERAKERQERSHVRQLLQQQRAQGDRGAAEVLQSAEALEARRLLHYSLSSLPAEYQQRALAATVVQPQQQRRPSALTVSTPPPLPHAYLQASLEQQAHFQQTQTTQLCQIFSEKVVRPLTEELRGEITRQQKLLEYLAQVQREEKRQREQAPRATLGQPAVALYREAQRTNERLGLDKVVEPYVVGSALQRASLASGHGPLPPLITITTEPLDPAKLFGGNSYIGEAARTVGRQEADFYEREMLRLKDDYEMRLSDEKDKRTAEQRAFRELLTQQQASMLQEHKDAVRLLQRESRLQQHENVNLAQQLLAVREVQMGRENKRALEQHDATTRQMLKGTVDVIKSYTEALQPRGGARATTPSYQRPRQAGPRIPTRQVDADQGESSAATGEQDRTRTTAKRTHTKREDESSAAASGATEGREGSSELSPSSTATSSLRQKKVSFIATEEEPPRPTEAEKKKKEGEEEQVEAETQRTEKKAEEGPAPVSASQPSASSVESSDADNDDDNNKEKEQPPASLAPAQPSKEVKKTASPHAEARPPKRAVQSAEPAPTSAHSKPKSAPRKQNVASKKSPPRPYKVRLPSSEGSSPDHEEKEVEKKKRDDKVEYPFRRSPPKPVPKRAAPVRRASKDTRTSPPAEGPPPLHHSRAAGLAVYGSPHKKQKSPVRRPSVGRKKSPPKRFFDHQETSPLGVDERAAAYLSHEQRRLSSPSSHSEGEEEEEEEEEEIAEEENGEWHDEATHVLGEPHIRVHHPISPQSTAKGRKKRHSMTAAVPEVLELPKGATVIAGKSVVQKPLLLYVPSQGTAADSNVAAAAAAAAAKSGGEKTYFSYFGKGQTEEMTPYKQQWQKHARAVQHVQQTEHILQEDLQSHRLHAAQQEGVAQRAKRRQQLLGEAAATDAPTSLHLQTGEHYRQASPFTAELNPPHALEAVERARREAAEAEEGSKTDPATAHATLVSPQMAEEAAALRAARDRLQRIRQVIIQREDTMLASPPSSAERDTITRRLTNEVVHSILGAAQEETLFGEVLTGLAHDLFDMVLRMDILARQPIPPLTADPIAAAAPSPMQPATINAAATSATAPSEDKTESEKENEALLLHFLEDAMLEKMAAAPAEWDACSSGRDDAKKQSRASEKESEPQEHTSMEDYILQVLQRVLAERPLPPVGTEADKTAGVATNGIRPATRGILFSDGTVPPHETVSVSCAPAPEQPTQDTASKEEQKDEGVASIQLTVDAAAAPAVTTAKPNDVMQVGRAESNFALHQKNEVHLVVDVRAAMPSPPPSYLGAMDMQYLLRLPRLEQEDKRCETNTETLEDVIVESTAPRPAKVEEANEEGADAGVEGEKAAAATPAAALSLQPPPPLPAATTAGPPLGLVPPGLQPPPLLGSLPLQQSTGETDDIPSSHLSPRTAAAMDGTLHHLLLRHVQEQEDGERRLAEQECLMELRMLLWEAKTIQLEIRQKEEEATAAASRPQQTAAPPLQQPSPMTTAAAAADSEGATTQEVLAPAASTQPLNSVRDPVTKFIFEWLREYNDKETLMKQRQDIVGGLHAAALAAEGGPGVTAPAAAAASNSLDNDNAHTPLPDRPPQQEQAKYNTRGLTTATSSSSTSTYLSSTNPSSYGPVGGHRFLRGGEQLAVMDRRAVLPRSAPATRPVLDAQERLQFYHMFNSTQDRRAPQPSDATSSTATTRYTDVKDGTAPQAAALPPYDSPPSVGIPSEQLYAPYAQPFPRARDSSTTTTTTTNSVPRVGPSTSTSTSSSSATRRRPPRVRTTASVTEEKARHRHNNSTMAPPAADTQASAGDQLTAAVLALQAKERKAREQRIARHAFDGPYLVATQSPPYATAAAQFTATANQIPSAEEVSAGAETRERPSKAGLLPFN